MGPSWHLRQLDLPCTSRSPTSQQAALNPPRGVLTRPVALSTCVADPAGLRRNRHDHKPYQPRRRCFCKRVGLQDTCWAVRTLTCSLLSSRLIERQASLQGLQYGLTGDVHAVPVSARSGAETIALPQQTRSASLSPFFCRDTRAVGDS